MDEIRIKRNGREELVFTGKELAAVEDHAWLGDAFNWRTLRLFRTSVGKYVLGSTLHMQYPRRMQTYSALIFSSKDDVGAYLRTCNGSGMVVDALLRRAVLCEQRMAVQVPAMFAHAERENAIHA